MGRDRGGCSLNRMFEVGITVLGLGLHRLCLVTLVHLAYYRPNILAVVLEDLEKAMNFLYFLFLSIHHA